MRSPFRGALIPCLTAFSLLPAGLTAQNVLGVGAGLVSATFTGDVPNELGSRAGVSLSAWFAIPVNETFDFVPGLGYTSKGYSLSDSEEDVTLKLGYIEIPLLLSLPFAGEPGSTTFHAFGGPNVAFEAGCTIDFDEGGTSGSEDCSDDDNRKKFDLAVVAGVGARLPVGARYSAFVNLGLNLGLTNIDEDEGDTIKNRALFASVGVAIPVGR